MYNNKIELKNVIKGSGTAYLIVCILAGILCLI